MNLTRKITGALLALAIGGITLAATAAPASAWTYQPVSGYRGNVSTPAVYVGDLRMPNGTSQFTLYSGSGPIAYRSAGSAGAQVVKAKYQVEQYVNGRWVVAASSPLMTGQIGATQSGVELPALYIQPNQARGYFRTTWAFDWSTPQGAVLGSTFVLSNHTTDHVCVTRVRWCQSQAGYVQTGGYFSNSW